MGSAIVFKHIQHGFTIIELMVSMTVGLLLMSVVGGIYFNAVRDATALVNRISMSRQAREMFDLLSMGGFSNGSNNTTYTQNYIFGIHGRISGTTTSPGWEPPSSIMALDSSSADQTLYRLGLSNNNLGPQANPTDTAYNRPIMTSEIGSIGGADGVSVNCDNANDPVINCASAGQSEKLRGYLRSDIDFSSGSVYRDAIINTTRMPIMLVNPYVYGALVTNNSNNHGSEDVYDTYWTAMINLVEIAP